MPRLSRPAFLALTRIEVGQLKTLDRRGQLPFVIDQAEGRGYEPGEVFLSLLAQALADAHALSVSRAADIAASLGDALSARWWAIVETGNALVAGTDEPPVEILAGRAVAAYPAPPRPVCGTLPEIAENLVASQFLPRGLVLVSASTVMATLIQRASSLDIEVPSDFWEAPLKYRQRPSPLTPQELADIMQEAKS